MLKHLIVVKIFVLTRRPRGFRSMSRCYGVVRLEHEFGEGG